MSRRCDLMLNRAAQTLAGLAAMLAALTDSAQAGPFVELEDRDDIERLEPVPSGNPDFELVRIHYWSDERAVACPRHYPAAYRPRLENCPVAKAGDDPLPGFVRCSGYYASKSVGCPAGNGAAPPIGYVACKYAYIEDFAPEREFCPDESTAEPPPPGLVACARRDKRSGTGDYFYARASDRCAPGGDRVIYGDDDRTLTPDATPQERAAARSVAAIVWKNWLWPDGTLTPERAGRGGLCSSERFARFPAPGRCTAFKVGARLVATAGHCIRTADQCTNNSFVFDFERAATQEAAPMQPPIPAERIYHCVRVLGAEQPAYRERGPDWSIIEVDREIRDVPAVQLVRTDKSTIPVGAQVTVIGHPMGLPKIVTPGGRIQRGQNGYFVIDNDTYGGNSGSPVFLTDSIDAGSPVAVGILVHGAHDFDEQKEAGSTCYTSRRCGKLGDSGCEGEGATYTGRFFDIVRAR